MILAVAAACGTGASDPAVPPSTADKRVDTRATLGTLPLGPADDGTPRIATVGASLRGWHHGPSLDPDDLHLLPYDAVYVGWELDAAGATVKGDAGVVWQLDAVDAGQSRFDVMRLVTCGPDVPGGPVAFRVTYATDDRPADPSADDGFRVAVPDRVGAAVARAPAGTATCADALAWTGEPAGWRRDRSAGSAVCAHLYRLGLGEDAVRCLLREPASGGTDRVDRVALDRVAPDRVALDRVAPDRVAPDRVSRQLLPRAPDDPAFDGFVLGALEPGAPGDPTGFAPYRVRALAAEVRDRGAVTALADRIALATGDAPGGLLPWQVGLVAAYAGDDPMRAATVAVWAAVLTERWATGGDPADAASAELALAAAADALPADALPADALAAIAARAAARPPPIACAPSARPAPERCGDPAHAAPRSGAAARP